MTPNRPFADLAALYADVGRHVSTYDDPADVLTAISETAVDRVPGAEWASITQGVNGSFTTVAATDEAAGIVDTIQYELGSGPCVDAVRQETVYRTDDLRTDERWPAFGNRAAQTYHLRSMLSFRLFLEDDDRIAGLNLYSTRTAAFDHAALVVGTVIASHAALAITAGTAGSDSLERDRALRGSRDIGVATAILADRHEISREQAVGLLRIASQSCRRTLAEVAADVVNGAALPLPCDPPPGPGRTTTTAT